LLCVTGLISHAYCLEVTLKEYIRKRRNGK